MVCRTVHKRLSFSVVMMPEKMNIINEKKTVTAERKVYMPFFK